MSEALLYTCLELHVEPRVVREIYFTERSYLVILKQTNSNLN